MTRWHIRGLIWGWGDPIFRHRRILRCESEKNHCLSWGRRCLWRWIWLQMCGRSGDFAVLWGNACPRWMGTVSSVSCGCHLATSID